MEILEDISSQLFNVDAKNLKKNLIMSVLLKVEECTKMLKQQNQPGAVVNISESLCKIFEGFLLDTIKPKPAGMDLIRKAIEFQKKTQGGFDKEIEEDTLASASEITGKLNKIISGREITEEDVATQPGEDEKREEAPCPPTTEDLPIEYDLPISSEEDCLPHVEFINSSTGFINEMENKILNLENNLEDHGLINEILRLLHNMRGAAGFLGFLDIIKLAYETEKLLNLARKREIKITKEAIDVLLESVDIIKRLFVINRAKIEQRLGKAPEDKKTRGVPIGKTLQRLEKLAAQTIYSDKKNTEAIAGSRLGEILVKKGEVSREQIEDALEVQEKKIGEILVEKGATTEQKIQEALNLKEDMGKKISPPIKVDTEKLDILMELVGELVIAQTLVDQDNVLSNEINQQISKNISNLGKITKSLQERVMEIRMIPLKQTFMKMHRLVRDVSYKTNKKVELRLSGVDTEIDKTIIDELSNPLVHLLRNSVDHGIEPPEVRIKAGKNKTGIIHLNAYHQGGNVVIELSDDGRGLPKEKIYSKALEKNLIEKDKKYSDREIYDLILLPGFSTAKVVSSISGRGVGMDVVARSIKSLGGELEIKSKEGEGSTFVIKLPLTLSIIDGMVVQVGSQRYIIPTVSILESIHPSKEAISTVKKKAELINVRGRLYPLIRLYRLFGIASVRKDPWDALVILIENNGKIKGIMVDDLLEQQQVVIKDLGKIFKPVKGISGGAILGNGNVGLILDAEGIINHS